MNNKIQEDFFHFISSNKETVTIKDIEDLESFIQRIDFEDMYEEMNDFINDFLLWNLKNIEKVEEEEIKNVRFCLYRIVLRKDKVCHINKYIKRILNIEIRKINNVQEKIYLL